VRQMGWILFGVGLVVVGCCGCDRGGFGVVLGTKGNTSFSARPFTRMGPTSGVAADVVEWRPSTPPNPICVFTVAVADASELFDAVVHNANWANAHGSTFTLFRSKMVEDAELESRWEKVAAARRMLHRSDEGAAHCRWLLFMDADAVVRDVAKAPENVLHTMQSAAVAASAPHEPHPQMCTRPPPARDRHARAPVRRPCATCDINLAQTRRATARSGAASIATPSAAAVASGARAAASG
jgi:hypothetical protein